MRMQRHLILILVGLMMIVVMEGGCSPLPADTADPGGTPAPTSPTGDRPTDILPTPSPSPAAPGATEPGLPSESHERIPPPPIDPYPVGDSGNLPFTPAESARVDLARRLNADVALIELAWIVTRSPDPDEMPCLRNNPAVEEVTLAVNEVEWMAFSVKGNLHHYIVVARVPIYCE